MADAMKMVPVEPGKVYVEVFGLTGTGKSAVMGEIEIALKALGLTVEHDADFQAEKNATHADWQDALDLYKPTVVLSERNVPRASPPAREEAPAEGAGELWPVGSWLSAALDDPKVCDAMKADIREWFDNGGYLRNRTSEPEAGAVAWLGDGQYEPTAAMIDAGLENCRPGNHANMIASFKAMMQQAELDGLVAHPAPATDDKLRDAVLFDYAWKLVEAIRGGGTPPFLTPEEAANRAAPYLLERLAERNAAALATLEGGEG